jgi:uncharacterized protein
MPNRLASETSPYLRQHADNPVDWWPWSEQALAAARAQNKPILLSIGYSACHWCHVMAHESFEDAATAALMNKLYINIKLDREERPDIDKIYQLAHQALTRRGGGWPLTVFLTPDDHLPFYAGTYFPNEPRYGMPPFAYVLQQVRTFWDERRDEVRTQNSALAEFLKEHDNSSASTETFTDAPISMALRQIENSFDARYGGHSGAPKFPHCPEMELLFDLRSMQMIDLTLQRMAEGGIHDQLGGGFCRYSVDERWEIPHFEKMLYDNAQLLPLYACCSRELKRDSYAQVAREILAWLIREMTAPHGGFYSALDADSEGEEGKFYVWKRDEVRALLDDAEFAVAERHLGFNREPNFEHEAWNALNTESAESIATSLNIAPNQVRASLASARTKLFTARSQRIHPGLDDKILTAWNALMISGIARSARSLEAAALIGLADNALDFLYNAAWRDDRLYASIGVNTLRFPAYLDDYAFLLDALIECLQCRWSSRDINWAIQIANGLLERFEDRAHGGFFFTAHDHENLIQRPKSLMDEAVPSGNGIAARALLRLGNLLGETRYLDAAERTLRAAYSTMQQTPHACASLLRALNDFLHPRTHVIIRYASANEEQTWRNVSSKNAVERSDIYLISTEDASPGALSMQKYTSGGVAYVCSGTQCLPAITDPADLREAMRS